MPTCFAICNELFEGWSWPEVCKLARGSGYEGIEIAPYTLAESALDISEEQRRELRASAEREGLRIVGLHWLLVKPEGLYLNHPDDNIRRKTSFYLCALVDLCADLGGSVMVFGSPNQRKVFPGLSGEQAWSLAKEAFIPPLDRAQTRRVTICLEPLSPEETDFINTAQQARQFIQEVGHPSLRLLLDVKAMSSEQKPIQQIIRESGGLVAHFHANDANKRGPGFGDTDFVPIAGALREIGYSGWVSVEVFDRTPDPTTIAQDSIAYLRQCFENGG
jgi:sugar phosphate isomerase/epimerase